ncbi:MAG: YegS/Rv2252/BmrU family lipid kinase, partial [Armatimonadetes bacterium]|nr:YegS/Rv2252/BmrU family lipid kinase [Armatimonadota bacterium]
MRVWAVVNPDAGAWRRPGLMRRDPVELVRTWLAAAGQPDACIRRTNSACGGMQAARDAAAAGAECVIAVGGDGAINSVVQGLMQSGADGASRPILGIVPAGSANVLARSLNIPIRHLASAVSVAVHGIPRSLDVGSANGVHFALVAGIGFDGAITRRVSRHAKRRFGEMAYAMAATQVALAYPRHKVTLTLDADNPRQFDAYLILVANGSRYAGRFHLGPTVRSDDGMFDVFVCLRRRLILWSILTHGFALASRRFHSAPGVRHFRARRVFVASADAIPFELDGDAAGEAP